MLIATPNTTHAAIACDLLERGIHVLCEKPLGDHAAPRSSACWRPPQRGGARLMTAHCLRFSPNLEMLKTVVDAGWLGHVRARQREHRRALRGRRAADRLPAPARAFRRRRAHGPRGPRARPDRVARGTRARSRSTTRASFAGRLGGRDRRGGRRCASPATAARRSRPASRRRSATASPCAARRAGRARRSTCRPS